MIRKITANIAIIDKNKKLKQTVNGRPRLQIITMFKCVVNKSTFDKRRLKHEMEPASTTAVGKKIQLDTQRLQKKFS